ncbi:leucine rich repeat LRR-containing protein [Nitzschia inconspicua]|uniref:Leucine rich repeat LRR-containing protein n=1 Tax=Nitzschia inconspicua TaxID=303405 RepID=A0A9K3LPS8_9STRA|nr:leucine rich repeat LRR-containing protein [Nitzschia inconspicua]
MIRSIRRAFLPSSKTHVDSEYTISKMEDQQLREVIDRLKKNDPDLTEVDFRNINGLRSYSSEGRTELFGELMEALSVNHTVKKVSVVLRYLDTLSLKEQMELFGAIGSLPGLVHLRVGSSGLTGLAMQLISTGLSQAKKLEWLNLQSINFRASTEHAIQGPTNTDDVEFVEFCRILRNELKELKTFILEDVEETFDLDALVESLIAMPSLEDISIKAFKFADFARLNQKSLRLLSSSTNLKSISLKRLHLHQLLPAFIMSLENNLVLECLNLEGNQMGRDCGRAFAYLIQFNSTLRELYLGCNLLPDEAGKEIANAVATNSKLLLLSLHTNFLGISSATAFANILGDQKCQLESLDLSQNSIQDEGGTSLALALHNNTKLKSLLLAETKVTKQTCDFFAMALAVNKTLERLSLADNILGDQGCVKLAEAIKINSSLKSLNLSWTKTASVGIMAMSRAMELNSSIVQLNLSRNKDKEGKCCQALETMVRHNTKLKHLWLPEAASSPNITFFIKLNRIGRDQLLHELANDKLWMKALLQVHDDVSSLMYLIRANPAVVAFLC